MKAPEGEEHGVMEKHGHHWGWNVAGEEADGAPASRILRICWEDIILFEAAESLKQMRAVCDFHSQRSIILTAGGG